MFNFDDGMEDGLTKLAKHYGYDSQSRQLIEEMAELTQAINKFWRNQLDCGKKPLSESQFCTDEEQHIAEEMADVIVTLVQVQELLGITDTLLKRMVARKIIRQLERLNHDERERSCQNCLNDDRCDSFPEELICDGWKPEPVKKERSQQ